MSDNPVFKFFDILGDKRHIFWSGYYRVILYTNIPDYESEWRPVYVNIADYVISFTHNIGIVPALVQCFFSCLGRMEDASPLLYF
jgi:hypothetical protein